MSTVSPVSTDGTSPAQAAPLLDPTDPPGRRASPRKLAANRANAARSTGPRSDAGKARSRLNALTHGMAAQVALLPGEDPEELQAFADELEADLRPRGAMERVVVRRIVGLSWRLARAARAEAAMAAAAERQRQEGHTRHVQVSNAFGIPKWPWEDERPPARQTGDEFIAQQFLYPAGGGRGVAPPERLGAYEQRTDRALQAALRMLHALRKDRAEGGDEEREPEVQLSGAPHPTWDGEGHAPHVPPDGEGHAPHVSADADEESAQPGDAPADALPHDTGGMPSVMAASADGAAVSEHADRSDPKAPHEVISQNEPTAGGAGVTPPDVRPVTGPGDPHPNLLQEDPQQE